MERPRAAEPESVGAPAGRAAPEGLAMESDGEWVNLGRFEPEDLITPRKLAEMFGKECEKSPMRAYKERGELPEPIRIMGKPYWSVGFLTRFIEERLKEKQREAQGERERLAR